MTHVRVLPNAPAPPSLYEPVPSTSTCLNVGWRPPPQDADGGEQPSEFEVAVAGPFLASRAAVKKAVAGMGDPDEALFERTEAAGGSGRKRRERGRPGTSSTSSDAGNTNGSEHKEDGSSQKDGSSSSSSSKDGSSGSVVWRYLAREHQRRSAFEVVQPGQIHAFRARCRNRKGVRLFVSRGRCCE